MSDVLWGNLADLASVFFGLSSLILMGVTYRRRKSKKILWLFLLIGNLTVILLLSSVVFLRELFFESTGRNLPDGYDLFYSVFGMVIFLLYFSYLVMANLTVHRLTTAGKRSPSDNLVLGLLLGFVFLGFLTFVTGRSFLTAQDDFLVAMLLSRNGTAVYSLIKLLKFDTFGLRGFMKKLRLILIVSLSANILLWSLNDTFWLMKGDWLLPAADALIYCFYTGFALVSLIVYTLTNAGRTNLRSSDSAVLKAELTHRERQILEMLAEGETYRGIAETLYISLNTVKTHAVSIYRKTQVRGKRELMRLYGSDGPGNP